MGNSCGVCLSCSNRNQSNAKWAIQPKKKKDKKDKKKDKKDKKTVKATHATQLVAVEQQKQQQRALSPEGTDVHTSSTDRDTDTASSRENSFGAFGVVKKNQVAPVNGQPHPLKSRSSTRLILQTASVNSLLKAPPVKSKSQRFATFYVDTCLQLAVYCSQFLMKNIQHRVAQNRNSNEPIRIEPTVHVRECAVLFLDISGFTALTESLANLESGAEIMSKYINGYFSLLVDVVTNHGGDVEKWAGDAMICIWHDDQQSPLQLLQRCIQCGMEIRDKYGTFQAGTTALTLHTAVASGTLHTFDMGGYNNQWLRYTFGSPFAELSNAVDESEEGQVVVTKDTFEKFELQNIVQHTITPNGNYLVRELLSSLQVAPLPLLFLQSSFDPLLRQFVDPYVQSKIDSDQQDYMSEMKYATIGFLSMQDSTGFPTVQQQLMAYTGFLNRVQQIIESLEGSIVNFLQDEKGALLAVAFGHPIAHSNDAYRTIRCLLKIMELLRAFDTKVGGGICSGKCFFGKIGSDIRSDFSVISDVANTAARLMKLSQQHGDFTILVDKASADSCRDSVMFEEEASVTLKGKKEKLQICRVIRESTSNVINLFENPVRGQLFIGRQSERERLQVHIDYMFKAEATKTIQHNDLIVISGAQGLGKTHLISLLFQPRHAVCYFCGVDTERNTDYHVFYPLATYFLSVLKHSGEGITTAPVDFETSFQQVEAMPREEKEDILQRYLPDHLKPYAAVFNPILDVQIPISSEMSALDEVEKSEIEAQLWVFVVTRSYKCMYPDLNVPMLIFDDYQHFDHRSRSVTQKLIDSNCLHAVCIVTVGDDGVYDSSTFDNVAHELITLPPLNRSEVEELLKSLAKCKYVSGDVLNSTIERTGGIPLLVQANYMFLKEKKFVDVLSDVLHFEKSIMADRSILNSASGNLNVILQQKIDKLDSEASFVLKVASVIGQSFSLSTMAAVFPEKGYSKQKLASIINNVLIPRGFIIPSSSLSPDSIQEEDESFEFALPITRYLCYSQMNGNLKRDLHINLAKLLDEYVTKDGSIVADQESPLYVKYRKYFAEIATHMNASYSLIQGNKEEVTMSEEAHIALLRKELNYIFLAVPYLRNEPDPQRSLVLLRRKIVVLNELAEDLGPDDWRYEQVKTRYWLIRSLRKALPIGSPLISAEIKQVEQYLTEDHDLLFELTFEFWFDAIIHSHHEKLTPLIDKLVALSECESDQQDVRQIVCCLVQCMTSYSLGDFQCTLKHAEQGFDMYRTNMEKYHSVTTTFYQSVDIGVMTSLYGARAALFLGHLSKSTFFDRWAETLAFKYKHPRTKQTYFLFAPYTCVIRRDYGELRRIMQLMLASKTGNEKQFDLTTQTYKEYINMYELDKKLVTLRDLNASATDERVVAVVQSMEASIDVLRNTVKELESMTQPNLIVYYVLVECVLRFLRVNPQYSQGMALSQEMRSVIDKCLENHQKNLTQELLRLRAELSMGLEPAEIDRNYQSAYDMAVEKLASLSQLRILTSWATYNPNKKEALLACYQTTCLPNNEKDDEFPDFKDARKVLASYKLL